ncbi:MULTISPECIES: hypothetical protein [Fischerella]|uniref:hypothetical protein n=1 Tax=Fischerella TaxID=1190 RepID=UPI0012F75D2C|nr:MULTISPECIES: hypothetical protein [Fischerella]MBD2431069.1 hypothetical protein [Fischerella sp. FACHB-380]
MQTSTKFHNTGLARIFMFLANPRILPNIPYWRSREASADHAWGEPSTLSK